MREAVMISLYLGSGRNIGQYSQNDFGWLFSILAVRYTLSYYAGYFVDGIS